jgi:hypothetical protein
MNKAKRVGSLSWIIMLFFVFIPSIVCADGEDIFTKFRLYGTVQEQYDTNINLTPDNKKADFLTTVSLELKFSTLPISETTREPRPFPSAEEGSYGIDLDFLPAYTLYARETNNNYLNLFGNLNGWYALNRQLIFRVRDYLLRSEVPLERNYAADALPNEILLGRQTGRSTYFRNIGQSSLDYRFGKEDVISVNYLNNLYRNQKSVLFEDSTEHQINPQLTYWFDIRNGIILEYFFERGYFGVSPDMIGNMARGRYTYRFNPSASVFGEFKFLRRDFSPETADRSNYNIYTPILGFDYAFSPRLSIQTQFGYFRETQHEGSGQQGPVYSVVLALKGQRTNYTLRLKGGATEDYFTAENLGFAKYNQVIGTITHQLTEKMTLNFSGRYERPKYNSGRLDNTWEAAAGASYRILKWLTPTLEFSYAKNHSNEAQNNYSDVRATFRIMASY